MKPRIWFGLWLLSAAVGAAQPPLQPTDFAYGLPLQATGEAAIYRLALPEIVYTHLTRGDYGDMRVFNAAGEVVPHSLRRPDAAADEPGEMRAVPYYPYALIKPGESGPARVQVTINEQGTVVSSNTGVAPEGTERISAYLIDVSILDRAPTKLLFDWESPRDSFVAPVTIEGSDDLDQWHMLVSRASLVRLMFAGRELGRNAIELPPRHYNYLKLSWPTSSDGVRLSGVQAQTHHQVRPVAERWLELPGIAQDGEENVFDYQVRGHLPVEWAELKLPAQNSLVDVKLYSRVRQDTPWQLRHAGSFYRLQVDGAGLASEPARLSPVVPDRQWRLAVVSGLSGLGVSDPVLRLGYTPHDLYFLARGRAPFVLAFGTRKVPVQQGEIGTLLARLDERDSATFIAPAHAGELIVLGGPDKLQALPAPFPWQRFVLWGVLVAGVLVLGVLAWRLGSQLHH